MYYYNLYCYVALCSKHFATAYCNEENMNCWEISNLKSARNNADVSEI